MTNFDDIKLFGKTSLSDIFHQAHKRTKDTDKQINELIDALKPLASSNAGSAVMLMPTVKDLIDVNVKNNEQLIKIAAIAQRAATSSPNSANDLIELVNKVKKIVKEKTSVDLEWEIKIL